uniref:Uncharacterized protein n=1 Tax=Arundo donax TaxID=35708 RepID=A0A0A9BVS4_ARUDO
MKIIKRGNSLLTAPCHVS